MCPAEHRQGLGKAVALGLAGLGCGGPRWLSTEGAEPGSVPRQPQTTLPTASQFAMTRNAGQAVASLPVLGPAVLLAGSQAAVVGACQGTSRASGRQLGGTGCASACQGFQSLSCAAWHGGAAAIPAAPCPAETGCAGHPCSAFADLPRPLLACGSQVPPGSKFSSQPEETGPTQLSPASVPPDSFRSPSRGTPGTPQGAQSAGRHSKGNVLLCLTCKAPGGRGPATPLPGPRGPETSLGLLRVPSADRDRDIPSLAPK